MTEVNRDKFRKWLEGHRPRQVVGYAMETDCCPLAQFIRHLGAKAPYVMPHKRQDRGVFFTRHPLSGRRDLPIWANSFGRRVDALGLKSSTRKPRITASRALKILDGINP